MYVQTLLAVGIAVTAMATSAGAVTFVATDTVFRGAIASVAPTSTTGTVTFPAVGTILNVYGSPYSGTAAPDAPFVAIHGNSSATYSFGGDVKNDLSFMWGSPDGLRGRTEQNVVQFFLDDTLEFTFTGSDLRALYPMDTFVPTGPQFANVRFQGPFDTVVLTANAVNAFEIANVSFTTPVPLPAGILLLGTAMAGFGAMRRRKAQSQA